MRQLVSRGSLTTKLIINVVAIHIILMGLVVIDMANRETSFISSHVANRGRDITEIVAMNSAIALLNNDVVALDEQIIQAQQIEALSQTFVMDITGRVLAASDHEYLNKIFTDDESTLLFNLIQNSPDLSVQLTHSTHTDTLAKIYVENNVIGYTRTLISKDEINQQLEIITKKSILYVLIAIILGAGFAWYAVKGITRNLRIITEHAHKLAEHQFDSTLPTISDRSELETLAHAFSVMQSSLHSYIEQNKQNELRWRFALSAEGNGVWDWNLATNEVFFSDTWKTMLGYKVDEIGSHVDEWSSRVHPDDLDSAKKDIERHLAGKTQIYQNQHRMRCKNGDYIWILDKGLIIERDENNKPLRMIGTHTDIHASKTVQQALLEAKHKAELANRAKSTFVANMSHEIRTPMAGIIGLIDLMMKTELNEQQRFYLERTQRSAKTLLGILNDILDYSKVEAGELKLEQVPFSVYELVTDVINLFKPKADELDLELKLRFAPEIPASHLGDPLRITQVLNNLIGNAIKFTKQGSIELAVSAVTSHHNESHLHFSVTDSGIGIDEAELIRIFKPFQQVTDSTTRNYGGTGLGLNISNQLVNLMGSNIEVRSELGKGSTFSFGITLQVNNSTKIKSQSLVDKAVEPQCYHFEGKVLLVEDNEINELIAKYMLEELGLEVQCARDGKEAVEVFNNNQFDLIFMDLHMPKMNGFEATECIRKFDSNIPIVALSAAVLEEEVKSTRAIGMNGHIGKPIDRTELLSVLQRFLSVTTGEQ